MMEQLLLSLAPAAQPTLENFLAGPNGAALQALRGLVSDSPDRSVHLWGPAGSGRTHLLRATAAAFMASGGSAAWITEGATALSARHLVLCDDVDRLDPAAQLLAFEMADEAGRHGARILTSAPHPAHALTLRDDLRTRLAQSLSISLTPMSEEDKRAALTAHATQRGFRLGPEIIDYMITRVRRDMGTLMGVLEALDRYSLSSKRPLTLPLAREVLQRSQF